MTLAWEEDCVVQPTATNATIAATRSHGLTVSMSSIAAGLIG
jgi:hypothetical protein